MAVTDIFQRRDSFLAGRLTTIAAVLVTLKRGLDTTPNVSASVDASEFEMVDGSGVVDRWKSRDFKIRAAAYIIAGNVVKPERGDLIIEAGVSRLVNSPKGVPHYVEDQNADLLRVHTWIREAE
jgi:hypothetical protein